MFPLHVRNVYREREYNYLLQVEAEIEPENIQKWIIFWMKGSQLVEWP